MKQTLKVSIALAIILVAAGYNVYISRQEVGMSDLALANVEALATGETGKCDNANGYRRILRGEERIYDCCYNEKIGRGREDCKRW